jgi:hypothetical protein
LRRNFWRLPFQPYVAFVRVTAVVLILCIATVVPESTPAYSVLTHEAIIDSAWEVAIKPLLIARFPAATEDELKDAYSYAYGGAIVADAGYYPFGNKFFSDLIHYVRSGEFVEALIRDSSDVNEYAFALGALAHYAADNNGHRLAVNLAVPMLYPKLERKFGNRVTYDQSPITHLKTEFGFDVIQVAKGHYASEAYHHYIGFNVSKPALEKAFRDTYSIELGSVFSNYDLAIGTFRRSVSNVIPELTRAAWQNKKADIQKDLPGAAKKKFIYNLSRADYEKEWHNQYMHQRFGSKIIALLIRLVPKIGPFRSLSFRIPTPEAEKLFMASFNSTLGQYKQLLQDSDAARQAAMTDINLDTGTVTGPGDYPLADKTYAELLDKLSKDHFANVSPELRNVLLAYYGNPDAPFATKKNKADWDKVLGEINELKSLTPASHAASSAQATSLGGINSPAAN